MLFQIETDPESDNPKGEGLPLSANILFPNGNKIESVLDLVKENACILWRTHSEWSAHELLVGLLMLTGPADVYLSSYGFSDHPARIIADLKNRGIIRKLFCLIDKRLDTRSAGAFNVIRNCSDKIKLADTHAKVSVIENESFKIVVMGSANYTTNKRHEAGVIICTEAAASFNKKWILDELNNTER